jgi:hypothetical protein
MALTVGVGLTVSVAVTLALQPAIPTEYVIVAEPTETPETIPVDVMLARAGLLLLHVPPVVASVRAEEEPAQMLPAPMIAESDGVAMTVSECETVAIQEPDPVTV